MRSTAHQAQVRARGEEMLPRLQLLKTSCPPGMLFSRRRWKSSQIGGAVHALDQAFDEGISGCKGAVRLWLDLERANKGGYWRHLCSSCGSTGFCGSSTGRGSAHRTCLLTIIDRVVCSVLFGLPPEVRVSGEAPACFS